MLEANISLMAGPGTNAAQAFVLEYVAFQSDWSAEIAATRYIPTMVFLAAQDPTTSIDAIPEYEHAFPWLRIETFPDAGLALLFQKANDLILRLAEAAAEVLTDTFE